MTATAPGRESVDVVVVGGRCSGAATSRLLARQGVDVLLVERSGYGSDAHSTHALTRTAVFQLSRWGVLDTLRASGTPRVERVDYHFGDDLVSIPITPEGDIDGLYAPRRWLLDRVLQDAAAYAGVDVRHHTSVRDLWTDDDGRVRGVVLEDASGTTTTVAADLVIGADGTRSFVAERVGATVERAAAGSTAVVYGFVDGLPDDAYVNHFRSGPDGGVSVGVIPTNAGEANVWLATSRDRFRRQGRGAVAAYFDRVLTEVDPDLASHVRQRADRLRLRSFPGLDGYIRQAWGAGWALTGDAYCFKDPISSHGITDAFVGADLLARSVGAMAAGVAEADALSDYAERHRTLTEPLLAALDGIVPMDWDLPSLRQDHKAMNRAIRDEWDAVHALPPIAGDLQPLSTFPTSTRAAVPGS